MARLAGILDSDDSAPRRLTETREFTRDNLREFFGGESAEDECVERAGGGDKYASAKSGDADAEPMTEANFRRILSREIKSAIEELRKNKGKPITVPKRKSRLI